MIKHAEILRAAAEWLDEHPVYEIQVLSRGNGDGMFEVMKTETSTWHKVTHWNKGDDPVARIRAKAVPTATEALEAWMRLLTFKSTDQADYSKHVTLIGRYLQSQRNRENGTET